MQGLSVVQFHVVCYLMCAQGNKHLINAGVRPLVLPLQSLKSGGLSQPELQMHHPSVGVCGHVHADRAPASVHICSSGKVRLVSATG